jgi:hypothetical protein
MQWSISETERLPTTHWSIVKIFHSKTQHVFEKFVWMSLQYLDRASLPNTQNKIEKILRIKVQLPLKCINNKPCILRLYITINGLF